MSEAGVLEVPPVLRRRGYLRRRGWIWMVVGVLGLLIGALLLVFLFRDRFLRWGMERALEGKTGMRATIEAVETGVGRPGVSIRGLRLSGPEGFGDATLLDLGEFVVEVSAVDREAQRVDFETMRRHVRSIHVVRGRDGKTNLGALAKAAGVSGAGGGAPGSGGEAARAPDGMQVGRIKEFILSFDEVRFTDLGDASRNRVLALGIAGRRFEDIATVEDLKSRVGGAMVSAALSAVLNEPDGGVGIGGWWKLLSLVF